MTRQPQPGCYGVVHLSGFGPALISSFTRSWANHVFIVGQNDDIIEAWTGGARVRNLSAYKDHQVAFSEPSPCPSATISYALSRVGNRYDWLSAAVMAAGVVTKSQPFAPVGVADTVLCTHLVALAGLAGGADWMCDLPMLQLTPNIFLNRLRPNPEVPIVEPWTKHQT